MRKLFFYIFHFLLRFFNGFLFKKFLKEKQNLFYRVYPEFKGDVMFKFRGSVFPLRHVFMI